MEKEETLLWMVLNALPEIGPATFRRLKERFHGRIHHIFSASYAELAAIGGISQAVAGYIVQWEKYFDLEREQRKLIAINARFVTQKDKNYPPLLRELHDAPIGLYIKGNLDLSRNNCIAMVGTRKATIYGLQIARDFARELATLGFIIVSGMALGIDSAAHEGALVAGGKTVAVLGSGIDVIYPPTNKALYERIAENNSIISEFPMSRKVDRITFPIRNRVIAGMCSHVIVIESDCRGGSMITAHIANEYGRHVMAVPGRADQRMSRGCHDLIRDGATLVSCMDHILEELAYARQQLLDFNKRDTVDVLTSFQDPVERKIVSFLREKGAIVADDLAMMLEVPIYYLIPRLQLLELRHVIRKNLEGLYEYYGS